MIEFKSFLAADLEAFVKYRRQIGYTYNGTRSFLAPLDRYLEETGAQWRHMSPLFFLEFRRTLRGEPGTANRVFIMLRSFFDYLVRMDRLAHNPLQDIPPLAEKAYVPFVFSPEEIHALLSAIERRVRKWNPAVFLSDLAVYTALCVMARCGLRISEPLRLKTDHYRPRERTLYIEKTKFNKDRLIPVPQNVAASMENFLAVRQILGSRKPGSALLAAHQGPISDWMVNRAFHLAVSDIGIHRSRQTLGNITFSAPRPHSLRHSFAVNTLKKACAKGRLPENVLPILAAYMGHTDYRYTMKYLKVLDAEHLGAWVDFCVFKRKEDEL